VAVESAGPVTICKSFTPHTMPSLHHCVLLALCFSWYPTCSVKALKVFQNNVLLSSDVKTFSELKLLNGNATSTNFTGLKCYRQKTNDKTFLSPVAYSPWW